jgi:hypothetical protein
MSKKIDIYVQNQKTFLHQIGTKKNGSRNHTIDAFKVHDIILGYSSVGSFF